MSDDAAQVRAGSVSRSEWQRTVTMGLSCGAKTLSYTEILDESEVAQRLHEAMLEYPDGSLSGWVDHALNGGEPRRRSFVQKRLHRGTCDRHGPYANTADHCPCQDEGFAG